ncbi:DUF3048 domain-containing protein [Ruicaihuangia caeni]|uniref:DUF3048 domain-containing protein n=1 Tax=Ruicaihuangia caeni TaxID=3042517 RepID=A0AAW6TBP0_9MICO|nr:DUF3048 domain-containing protein [Klugiella sp. YN-L-19]MDI2098760.1 DUF3048 domain-containing protein [Klugiella sp. YN-L-19]
MQGFRRRASLLVPTVILAAALVGCSSAEPAVEEPEPTWHSDYEAPPPVSIAPLTGVAVEGSGAGGPSLAAKIDNHPAARPQIGLAQTDIVFEELVEGGLTRYVAVWQSHLPPVIGPVRSIRPMDPDIISPLGGMVAYSGGQERFVAMMKQAPVYNAIHGQSDTASTFYRASDRRAPHNVLVKAPELVAQHAELPPPAQYFAFAADAASSTAAKEGTPTAGIALVFGSLGAPSWTWDAAASVWTRSMTGGAPDTDETGAPLTAENVVVVRVPVTVSQDIPKTESIGSGEAWVSSGGATVHATWHKGSATEPIRLIDDHGVTVRLAPGNTWVELVPTAGSATFTAP